MRTLAVTLLSLMSISLSAQASPSDAMKSFLTSKIGNKSVNEVFCKWDDQVAVTDTDVAQLKEKILVLIPQLGIPALQNLAGISASDLQVSGSPNCSQSLKPRTFGVGVRSGFSIRAFISDINGQEIYRIGVNSLVSEKVSAIYKQVAPLVQMGLGINAMDNVVKMVNANVVPLNLKPRSMDVDNINGVGSLNINFAEIAKAGELFSLSLMADGTLMALNQLNVDLNSQSTAGAPVATYEIVAVARCICNASMIVRGDNGQAGSVLDSQKVSSIKIRVQNKEVVLQNPPGGIRDYYAGAENDAWVKAELAKKGIKLGNNDSVDLISFTGSVTLYTNENGTTPISQ
jgi:hypothetical protein